MLVLHLIAALALAYPGSAKTQYQSDVDAVIQASISLKRVDQFAAIGQFPPSEDLIDSALAAPKLIREIVQLQAQPEAADLSEENRTLLSFSKHLLLVFYKYFNSVRTLTHQNELSLNILRELANLQIQTRRQLMGTLAGFLDQPFSDSRSHYILVHGFLKTQSVSYDLTPSQYRRMRRGLAGWPALFRRLLEARGVAGRYQKEIILWVMSPKFGYADNLFSLPARQIVVDDWRRDVISGSVKHLSRPAVIRSQDIVNYQDLMVRAQNPPGLTQTDFLIDGEKRTWQAQGRVLVPGAVSKYMRAEIRSVIDLFTWVKRLAGSYKARSHLVINPQNYDTSFLEAHRHRGTFLNGRLRDGYLDILTVIATIIQGNGVPGVIPAIPGSHHRLQMTDMNFETTHSAMTALRANSFDDPSLVVDKLVDLYASGEMGPLLTEYNLKLLADFLRVLPQVEVIDDAVSTPLRHLFHLTTAHTLGHPRIIEIAHLILAAPSSYDPLTRLAALNYLIAHSDRSNSYLSQKNQLMVSFPQVRILKPTRPWESSTWTLGAREFYGPIPLELKSVWIWQQRRTRPNCEDELKN